MTDHTPTNADDDAGESSPTHDSEGTPKKDGLGEGDGTIPNHPGGIAAGHTGNASTFEPEEDEHA